MVVLCLSKLTKLCNIFTFIVKSKNNVSPVFVPQTFSLHRTTHKLKVCGTICLHYLLNTSEKTSFMFSTNRNASPSWISSGISTKSF